MEYFYYDTLYSAPVLPVQYTGIALKMYDLCQSSYKAWKVKEATNLLMSDEYGCFKDNPLPMYELVIHANCTVALILEPQTFFKLTLS